MKHLSITTIEFPLELVAAMDCDYEMGDDFVGAISEVDCESCKKQIAEDQYTACSFALGRDEYCTIDVRVPHTHAKE